jgi:hypothetical protein
MSSCSLSHLQNVFIYKKYRRYKKHCLLVIMQAHSNLREKDGIKKKNKQQGLGLTLSVPPILQIQ